MAKETLREYLNRKIKSSKSTLAEEKKKASKYKSISAAPKGTSHHGQTLFIRGELSEYIANHHVPIIMNLFPNARIETIDGCSHWLHSEKPKEFSKILLNFLA